MNSIDRFKDICEARMDVLRGTVASRATSYVNTDNPADKREAKQAMTELQVWKEVYGHFKSVFEVE